MRLDFSHTHNTTVYFDVQSNMNIEYAKQMNGTTKLHLNKIPDHSIQLSMIIFKRHLSPSSIESLSHTYFKHCTFIMKSVM